MNGLYCPFSVCMCLCFWCFFLIFWFYVSLPLSFLCSLLSVFSLCCSITLLFVLAFALFLYYRFTPLSPEDSASFVSWTVRYLFSFGYVLLISKKIDICNLVLQILTNFPQCMQLNTFGTCSFTVTTVYRVALQQFNVTSFLLKCLQIFLLLIGFVGLAI